ncbi:MAG: molybdopterin molybdotransferase MoeA [Proteobacteria bacterium]|nr:molybdopterin molybdotransferase MoeA [Pseudomonadota bacterium]
MKKNDIRMRGFQQRTSVGDFNSLIDQHCLKKSTELLDVTESGGRVLSKDLSALVNVPNFDRSAMDGYALRGEETFGASNYNPISFNIKGIVTPGREFAGEILPGETVQIMTGAPIPTGADAVLMVELAEQKGEIMEALDAVPPGKHVGLVGEDIKVGEKIFKSGRLIRPQDAAVMASVGIGEVPVTGVPQVDLLITGDELLKPGEKPHGVFIVDSNSVILRQCIKRDGAVVSNIHHLPDDKETIRKTILDSTADLICITGGTAVGSEDFAPILIQELGQLLVHGISMRPASPTGFGLVGSKKVFLLPGNPVSCLSAYDFFVARALRNIGDRGSNWTYQKRSYPLVDRISSPAGRLDYVRVRLDNEKVHLIATGGASILSSTTKADGFVIVNESSEGFGEGEMVDVWLYDK